MLSLINLRWTLVSFRGKKLYFGLLQRIGSSDLKLTSLAPINSKLQHSLPRATNGHLTVVYVGGWWVWTLAGCGWEVSSIPSRTHVFLLLMWRFFKVKSSLSWAGSERKVYKVWVLKLGQCEESHGRWFCPLRKIDSQIRLLGEHLNSIWPRVGRNLNEPIFKSSNARRVAQVLRKGCWSFELMDALIISIKLTRKISPKKWPRNIEAKLKTAW